MGAPARASDEAYALTVRAVALRRGGAGPGAVLATIDQARASLRTEPNPVVAHTLAGVCHTLIAESLAVPTGSAVDSALRIAARVLDDARHGGC